MILSLESLQLTCYKVGFRSAYFLTQFSMAYSHKNSKGQTYYLHTKDVNLRGGRRQTIYYFAREVKGRDALDLMPAGYKVVENKRTGLPMLKKVK